MRTDQINTLMQVVTEVSQQVRALVAQISDLAALVQVEDVKRSDLERRVRDLEAQEHGTRDRQEQNLDQWRLALTIVFFSTLLSLVATMVVHLAGR